MKLPFDLGYKLLFRLIIPGLIMAFGFLPLMNYYINELKFNISLEFWFISAIVLFGWLIIILDMPIYMLFEGRRYWPKLISEIFLEKEKLRLCHINNEIDKYYGIDKPSTIESNKYLEASVEIRNYPIGEDGSPTVRYPTRLGNAIMAYETYSDSRYNINAIFYWPRIWISLSNDVRQEIDNQQTLCDSALYSSFSAVSSSTLWLIYMLVKLIDLKSLYYLSADLPAVSICLLISLSLIILHRITYCASIQTNIQYGNIFVSVIDYYADKTQELICKEKIKSKINEMKVKINEDPVKDDSDIDIRRYLLYNTIKIKTSKRPVPYKNK